MGGLVREGHHHGFGGFEGVSQAGGAWAAGEHGAEFIFGGEGGVKGLAGMLLAFEEDADELGEGVNFAVLDGDNGEEFEDEDGEEGGDAEEGDRAVFDVHAVSDIGDRVGPAGQAE